MPAVLSVPTTGFAVAAEAGAGSGSVRARFFTPRREIDACGHVTIATATALVDVGVWARRQTGKGPTTHERRPSPAHRNIEKPRMTRAFP